MSYDQVSWASSFEYKVARNIFVRRGGPFREEAGFSDIAASHC